MAVAGAIRSLAAKAPVLIAIDDVPWLDEPTARAVAFAVRRLNDLPLGVLFARRNEPSRRGVDDDLIDASTSFAVTRTLAVGPLNLRGLHRLLTSRRGHPLSRPQLVRLSTASGGNPLFALEIAGALDRRGSWPGPEAPLPVPDRLRDLVAHRLAELSPADRSVLLLVAASLSPGAAAAALDASPEPEAMAAVERAERAGLLTRDDGVRIAHPLVASALYGGATTSERRAAHLALADLAGTVE